MTNCFKQYLNNFLRYDAVIFFFNPLTTSCSDKLKKFFFSVWKCPYTQVHIHRSVDSQSDYFLQDYETFDQINIQNISDTLWPVGGVFHTKTSEGKFI